MRDDNSLIKSLPNSLMVASSRNSTYRGRVIGTGFVASHVWRTLNPEVSSASGAAYDPFTYSFVPNLVWLPGSIAGLTDRIDSFAQRYIQALSWKIYRSYPLTSEVDEVVRESWARLPLPAGIPDDALPDLSEVNFFETTPKFVLARRKPVAAVSGALSAVSAGSAVDAHVVSSRYAPTLATIDRQATRALSARLERYLDATAGVTVEPSTVGTPRAARPEPRRAAPRPVEASADHRHRWVVASSVETGRSKTGSVIYSERDATCSLCGLHEPQQRWNVTVRSKA